MKCFGYKSQYDDDLLELQEVVIECTYEEFRKIQFFLEEMREEHQKTALAFGRDYDSSHFRDWDKDWKETDSDFILVTE